MDHYPWLQSQQGPTTSPALITPDAASQRSSTQIVQRAPDAAPMDLGAQVAAGRNLEFTAGDRAHRLSIGSYTKA